MCRHEKIPIRLEIDLLDIIRFVAVQSIVNVIPGILTNEKLVVFPTDITLALTQQSGA